MEEKRTGILPEDITPGLELNEIIFDNFIQLNLHIHDMDSFLKKIEEVKKGRIVSFSKLRADGRNLKLVIIPEKGVGTRRL